ncbi:MAG: hypothetical protein ACRYGR_01250 [Janthinobacterium lividum]
MNTISNIPSVVQTYSAGGQIQSQPIANNSSSVFADFVKQAIDHSRTHENAAIEASQGKMSTLELAKVATNAELALQEFNTYLNKAISALNDVTKSSM